MHSLIIRLFILSGLLLPTLASADTSVEFYNAGINHYFMTASPDEAVALDNKPEWGWTRTGKTFNVWLIQASAPSNASPVCRFFGLFSNGTVGSHFYTVDTDECAYVKNRLDWSWASGYEGYAFYAVKPTGGSCPSGTFPVYRVFNNGMGGAPNHRYMTSQTDVDTMVSQGWASEGIAMCALPALPTTAEMDVMESYAISSLSYLLKVPSSFRLVGSTSRQIYSDNISGSISFTFEAQNSFGVYLRNYAICSIGVSSSGVWRNEINLDNFTFCYIY